MFPVIVSATTSAISQNGTGGFPVNTPMRLPQNRAALINELRFTVVNPSATGGPGTDAITFDSFYSAMMVRLQLGRWNLTRDYVPILALTELTKDLSSPASAAVLTCKLPEPLYFPAGETLQASFSFQTFGGIIGASQPASLTATMSMHGQVLPSKAPPPKNICLPWFAHVQNVSPATSVLTTWQSTEADLYNPETSLPLYISRFSGYVHGVATEFRKNNMTPGTSVGLANAGLFFSSAKTTVQLVDQRSGIIVRDKVPLGDLMQKSLAWKTPNTYLDPRGYVIATVDSDFTLGSNNQYVTTIGMVGYREVPLR